MDGESFEYRGWLVRIEIDAVGEMFAGHADLHFNGDHRCRVALATSRADEAGARQALTAKARNMVDERIAQAQTNPSNFSVTDHGSN